MCEHNLVIGEFYEITNLHYHCPKCDFRWNSSESINVQYLGDASKSVHQFKNSIGEVCPSCNHTCEVFDFLCGDGGPIDVTQEFLSLPVRSRE